MTPVSPGCERLTQQPPDAPRTADRTHGSVLRTRGPEDRVHVHRQAARVTLDVDPSGPSVTRPVPAAAGRVVGRRHVLPLVTEATVDLHDDEPLLVLEVPPPDAVCTCIVPCGRACGSSTRLT